VRLGSFISLGLLPETLRRQFGFRWTARDERRLRRLAALLRRARRVLPDALCVHPLARRAERHLRAAPQTASRP
jgi:uncharacterized protein (DUF2236 family)